MAGQVVSMCGAFQAREKVHQSLEVRKSMKTSDTQIE